MNKLEIEQAIQIGIRPAMGDRGTIISVIHNILNSGFDWAQQGDTLIITHQDVVIRINGGNVQFDWNS